MAGLLPQFSVPDQDLHQILLLSRITSGATFTSSSAFNLWGKTHIRYKIAHEINRLLSSSGGIVSLRGWLSFERHCPGRCGVPVPGGVQEVTQCQGLVDKVVFGQRLGLMILEVFSNLGDSMVLVLVIVVGWSELQQRPPSDERCF